MPRLKALTLTLACCLLLATNAVAQNSSVTTTARDRRSVNITVYNSNIGLVRKTRSLSLLQEQAFFEYHLYTLARPATIREQETKQVSLLEAANFDVSKEFVINGATHYYRTYNNPGEVIKDKVGVYMQFRNSEQNRLGIPLPAGTVRLYKKDKQGGQQFIGEDRIDHTPKDEDVRVKVGDALFAARFRVPVEKDGEAKLSYHVRVKY